MDKMTFRFDDVCINADIDLHNKMTDFLIEKFECEVIWAISPLVYKSEKETGRVFPKKWNALSDHRVHYMLNDLGIPKIHPKVIKATHGLIHVDHRLLTRETQELSILLSAAFIDSTMFVPPFNKWDRDTDDICYDNGITLIKFENGWLGMEHNKYNKDQKLWYLHAREWTLESFKAWFK